jgi:hypothetical protein
MPEAARPSRPGVDGHAGEVELASIMAGRSEFAHPDRAGAQSVPIISDSTTQVGPRLQNEFFEESTHRVDTKQ